MTRRSIGALISLFVVFEGYAHAQTLAVSNTSASEGARVYGDLCARCHGAGLGGGIGPALKGKAFVAEWRGKRARQLYSKILMTMPGDSPGSLSSEQVIALVSYPTKQNALASIGQRSRSPDDLNGITLLGER